jgi:hypothetical protein
MTAGSSRSAATSIPAGIGTPSSIASTTAERSSGCTVDMSAMPACRSGRGRTVVEVGSAASHVSTSTAFNEASSSM